MAVPERLSVAAVVASKLVEMIDTGLVPAGHPLPSERELATRLRVSRATVREAVHELTLRGVLERKSGTRTAVTVASTREVRSLIGQMEQTERSRREVYDFRAAFEPTVARLAAARATELDITTLRARCAVNAGGLTMQESLDLDVRFHQAIAFATRNKLIMALISTTAEWIQEIRQESHATASGRERSAAGHRRITEAIEQNDAQQAYEAMLSHIREASHEGNRKANLDD